MTRVVHKYQLDENREVVTPIQSEFLTVNEVNGDLYAYFLVRVNQMDKKMKEKHQFTLQPTGAAFKHDGKYDYVTTFYLENQNFILHLFKNKDTETTI